MRWETPGGYARSGCKGDGPIGLFNEFLEIGKLDAHAFEEGWPVGTELIFFFCSMLLG